MIHPAADQARAALKALKSTDAAEILQAALASDPTNPDLICERGHVGLFTQREADAVALLPMAVGGLRYRELEQQLAEHFYCVKQAGGKLAPDQAALVKRVSVDSTRVGNKISACLIVKDEERHLDRCLASLKGIVDQIVVVDTGSADRTLEIAAAHHATVGQFEWCQDFAAARNHSLTLATGNWILWIDADEEIAPGSQNAFRQASVRPQFGGYNIEIVNYVDDRESGNAFVHCPIRLFRNLPGVTFVGSIHEQVVQSLDALGLPWARLDNTRILHSGYRPSEVESKGKQERTLTMLEAALEQNPEDGFQWFNYSNALTIAREYDRAITAAREAIRLTPECSTTFGALAYQILALALGATDQYAQSLEACDEADAGGCGGMLIEFERAQTLLKTGRHDQALEAIDRSMSFDWDRGQSGDRGIETHKRHIVRGQILAVLGRHEDALDMFDFALAVDPAYGPCLFCKAATLEKLERFEEAATCFHQAGEDEAIRHTTLKGEARCLLAVENLSGARDCYRAAWLLDTQDIESWIRWCSACADLGDGAGLLLAYEAHAQVADPSVGMLINWARALASNGQAERALQLFTEAIRREPENANAYFNCGDLLYSLGNMYDAAHLYESGLKLAPENADAWFTLGNSLAKLGIVEGAAISYRRTLEIRPDHLPAQHNLEQIAA